MIRLGIDTGGSSLKAAAVDLGTGALLSGPRSFPTPAPSTPAARPETTHTPASALVREATSRPAVFLNDADAAGLAEMRFGAGRGEGGTVLLLTLGTGIGSALFRDGLLLPNTELGHMEIRGREAEHRASARVRTAESLGWEEWAQRLNEVLARFHALLWPDLFILGGGVSENWPRFGHLLESPARILPARLGNDAGIIGAALATCER